MTIPIRNLYYIFCYAWARFPKGDEVVVGEDDCPDLPNLFAKLLIEATHRLLRRGLDRGYIEHVEEMAAPRGKLDVSRMIKEQTRRRCTAICSYDELEHDVLHNQIIKATAGALISSDTLKADFRHELRLIREQLSDVSNIRLTAGAFRRVRLSRDRYLYGMLMRLSEFVFHSVMPDEAGESAKFADILVDEVRMSSVFEEFLRNFYSYELDGYDVSKTQMTWGAEALTPGAAAILPIMETDIVLSSAKRTMIIDAKYYKEVLVGRAGFPKKIRSGHLYQLAAYMRRAAQLNSGKQIDGALIYPTVGHDVSADYKIFDNRVRVITIDLSREWKDIHSALIDVPVMPYGWLLDVSTDTSAEQVTH
ncbi:MAG TPA: hypothetical protein VGU01_14760 [Sphingomicrobium sp.]|nr:hypothetical protein [Sphingomicrobium sp.]